MLADITPVILTYNEAANIGRSLERLAWAREVVVVDSGSTDETLAIAARFSNVRTVHRPFDTHAEQWRFATGETGVATDWVLRLDADYLMDQALHDEIAALAPVADLAAYESPLPTASMAGRSGPRFIRRCRCFSGAGGRASSRMVIPRSYASTARSVD